jgi:hypothetical protein
MREFPKRIKGFEPSTLCMEGGAIRLSSERTQRSTRAARECAHRQGQTVSVAAICRKRSCIAAVAVAAGLMPTPRGSTGLFLISFEM